MCAATNMPKNELTLDPSEYSDLISDWENGGTYLVEVAITQTSNDGKTFKATVNEVTSAEDVEMEEEAPPAKKPAKVPVAKV